RRAGIAHRDAETAPLEHRDIVAAISEDGDLRHPYGQQMRKFGKRDSLVGKWAGDVEIVWLRACDGSLIGERGAHIALALRERLESRADADDLGGNVEGRSKILDDRWPEPHRALLEP